MNHFWHRSRQWSKQTYTSEEVGSSCGWYMEEDNHGG